MMEINRENLARVIPTWKVRIGVVLSLCFLTYAAFSSVFCAIGYETPFVPTICYLFNILYILIPVNIIFIILTLCSKRFVKISLYYAITFFLSMFVLFPLVGKFWDQRKYDQGYDKELSQSISEYKTSVDEYFHLNRRDESRVLECTISHLSKINNFRELKGAFNFDICGIKYFFDPNRSDEDVTYGLLKHDRPELRGFIHGDRGGYLNAIGMSTKFKVYLFPKIVRRSGMNLIHQGGIVESVFVDGKWVDFRPYAVNNLKEQ